MEIHPTCMQIMKAKAYTERQKLAISVLKRTKLKTTLTLGRGVDLPPDYVSLTFVYLAVLCFDWFHHRTQTKSVPPDSLSLTFTYLAVRRLRRKP